MTKWQIFSFYSPSFGRKTVKVEIASSWFCYYHYYWLKGGQKKGFEIKNQRRKKFLYTADEISWLIITRRLGAKCLKLDNKSHSLGSRTQLKLHFVCIKVCNLSSDKEPEITNFFLMSFNTKKRKGRREGIEEVETYPTWCIRYTNIRYDYSAHKNNFRIQIFCAFEELCSSFLFPWERENFLAFLPSRKKNMSLAFLSIGIASFCYQLRRRNNKHVREKKARKKRFMIKGR